MSKKKVILTATLLSAFALVASSAAEAKCVKRAATGTALTKSGAQFQVKESILQQTDWGVWATWMITGNTPGYRIGKYRFKCKPGGFGYTCDGQATVCTAK